MKISNERQKDFGTAAVAQFVRSKGITMKSLSEKTGISYGKLQRSFKDNRPLTADELLSLCSCLDVDPMMFRAQNRPKS